jgi:predicted dehydrogenase
VFQNRRWDGDFLTVRKLIADGALGPIHRLESRFERWNPVPRPGWRESGDPADAGGLLFDLGAHLVDQAVQLFGPVRAVYGELDRRRAGVVIDDDAFVALTHASGVRSHLWMSSVAGDDNGRFRVLGSKAAYLKFGLDLQEAVLRGARTGIELGEEPPEHWGRIGAGETWETVLTERGAYVDYYAGIERSLREGTPPPVDPADAITVLEVIEAARRSAMDGVAAPTSPGQAGPPGLVDRASGVSESGKWS